MNKEQFNINFQQLKPYILDRWNKLTDEDLRQINGRFELLISKIQERYGLSREAIEEQFRNFAPNLRFDRERDVTLTKRHEEEGSSLGKWLLAAGIPFLFLLGYLGTHYNTPAVHDNAYSTNSNQTLYTTTPAATVDSDATLSQNIRKVLLANSQLLNDLRDLRIESSNGTVTLYGTVRTDEQKSLIDRLVERISGVKKIDNKIEVK
ncbi:MAG TPA: BON domain-containing protein [Parachlamydiaceae bacterium]|nr:BON domain-containing protein [Parachlamydiaceae bacterium]